MVRLLPILPKVIDIITQKAIVDVLFQVPHSKCLVVSTLSYQQVKC